MGVQGFEYSDASEIFREISDLVDGFEDFTCSGRKACRMPFEVEITASPAAPHRMKTTRKEYPYLLYTSPPEHAYRGFPITAWVEGFRALSGEAMVDINSEDAARADISNGDGVAVTSPDFEQVCRAQVLDEQPRGTLHVALRPGDSIGGNPHPAKIRKYNV